MKGDTMNPGDVVQLKSGGPLMTVESVDQSGVICVWFDAKHNRKQERFPEATLKPYDEDDGGDGFMG
jgi:uncharacterized protein YodC (DUF2158 family)